MLQKYDKKNYMNKESIHCLLPGLAFELSLRICSLHNVLLLYNYLNEILALNASGKGRKLQQYYVRTIDKHPAQNINRYKI